MLALQVDNTFIHNTDIAQNIVGEDKNNIEILLLKYPSQSAA